MIKKIALLPDIDKTIHELARLKILATLSVVESGDYTYLMNFTGLSWGNLSVQVTKLKDAGFVRVEKQFIDNKPNSTASITLEGRKAFDVYRKSMAELLGL